MKITETEASNGPVEKEDEEVEERGRGDGEEAEEEEEEREEDCDIEEFLKLDAELDALSCALDTLEQRNDAINDRLRKILEENRAIREVAASEAKKMEQQQQ